MFDKLVGAGFTGNFLGSANIDIPAPPNAKYRRPGEMFIRINPVVGRVYLACLRGGDFVGEIRPHRDNESSLTRYPLASNNVVVIVPSFL